MAKVTIVIEDMEHDTFSVWTRVEPSPQGDLDEETPAVQVLSILLQSLEYATGVKAQVLPKVN